MIFLLSLVLAGLFVRFCAGSLKSHPVPYYVGAVVLAVAVPAVTMAGVQFPAFVSAWVWPIFSRCAFATALFALVMWAGALPNGSAGIKKLMPIRGELSILACILTLGHNVAYGRTYFRMLFTQPADLPLPQLLAAVCSLVMLVIMLPLFVTSFKSVRRKMDPRTWKRLQRSAYGFYGLLYVHVLLLSVPFAMAGNVSYIFNLLVYSVVFLGYAVCRVVKHHEVHKKDTSRLVSHQRKAAVVAAALSLCLCLDVSACGSTPEAEDEDIAAEDVVDEEEAEDEEAQDGEKEEDPAQDEEDAAQEETKDADKDASKDTTKTEDKKTETKTDAKNDTKTDTKTDTKQDAKPSTSGSSGSNSGSTGSSSGSNAAASTPAPAPAPEPVRVYKNGTFSGSGQGFAGSITVSVSIQNDVITGISVVSSVDDEPYLSNAKGVISKMLSAQSANVSAVSGATYSSNGIISAVRSALASAKN